MIALRAIRHSRADVGSSAFNSHGVLDERKPKVTEMPTPARRRRMGRSTLRIAAPKHSHRWRTRASSVSVRATHWGLLGAAPVPGRQRSAQDAAARLEGISP